MISTQSHTVKFGRTTSRERRGVWKKILSICRYYYLSVKLIFNHSCQRRHGKLPERSEAMHGLAISFGVTNAEGEQDPKDLKVFMTPLDPTASFCYIDQSFPFVTDNLADRILSGVTDDSSVYYASTRRSALVQLRSG